VPNGVLVAPNVKKANHGGETRRLDGVPFATRPLYSRSGRFSNPHKPAGRAANLLDSNCQDSQVLADTAEASRRSRSHAPAGRLLGQAAEQQPPVLTARRLSALVLGWGTLNKDDHQPSNTRFDGRDTLQEEVQLASCCRGSVGQKALWRERRRAFFMDKVAGRGLNRSLWNLWRLPGTIRL
jgi:hypothetical protein